MYWQIADFKFVNTQKSVKEKFDISQTQLSSVVNQYSILSLYIYCKSCQSFENQKVKSRAKYIEISKHKIYISFSSHLCKLCSDILQVESNRKKEEETLKQEQKYKEAIVGKYWNNLNYYDKKILSSCLEMNFNQLKTHYGRQLGKENFVKLIRSLERIAEQNLITLERDKWTNYILDYQYYRNLSDWAQEIKEATNLPESTFERGEAIDELKFKLTINENQYHPDSPKYAGTVTFKERIIIEPGVEYIFGVWQRANEHLYLTMIPITNLDKLAVQNRINDKPISLREGIQDFLNTICKNF